MLKKYNKKDVIIINYFTFMLLVLKTPLIHSKRFFLYILNFFFDLLTLSTPSNDNNTYETNTILEDFKAVLDGSKNATLTQYMYWGKKDYFGELVQKNKDYYLYNDEISIINSNIKKIQKHLDGCNTIVDLGPGSKTSFMKKTLPLLQNIKTLSRYYSVDISEKYAYSAANLAKKHTAHISSEPIVGDMENLTLPQNFHLPKDKKLFLFTGSTLSSSSNHQIDLFFKTLSSYMKVNDLFFITCDITSNIDSLLKAYDNKYAKDLVLNSLKHANKKLNTNINFKQISLECNWQKKDKTINYDFVSSYSQRLQVQNQHLEIKNGKRYSIVKSRKFKPQTLESMFTKHNFDVTIKLTSHEKRIVIYVLKLTKKSME